MTQYAVFEQNSATLWSTVRQSIEHFLAGLWCDGALAGSKAEEAFFVRVATTR
jgi:uncharacterized protein